MCYHWFYLNCLQVQQCCTFPFGDTSQEIFALTQGLSCHGWLLLIQGKPLGQTMHEQGRRRRWLHCPEITVLWDGGPPPWPPGGSHAGHYSCWTWQKMTSWLFFFKLLFLLNQNNSYSHPHSINTVYLDMSTFSEQRERGINSFSIEITMNTNVVLFPKDITCVFVCGQVCQSICIHQFHFQTCTRTEALFNTHTSFHCTVFYASFLFQNAINMVVC